MSIETRYSVGTVSAGEGALTVRPKFAPTTPKPGVMFVHGAGSDATYCISPLAVQSSLTRLVGEAGYTAFSGDLGGTQTWGNSVAVARMTAAYNHLQTLGVKPGEVALISASMGGLTSFNWAAQNPSKVACIITVIPVINVTDIHANNRSGYAGSINGAYGGAWSQGSFGAMYNPKTLAAAGKFADIPTLIFYGTTDTLCLPTETEAFATSVGPNVELVPLAAGHDFTSYSLVDHPAAVAFLKTHAV